MMAHVFPVGLDLCYTNAAQPLTMAGKEQENLDLVKPVRGVEDDIVTREGARKASFLI